VFEQDFNHFLLGLAFDIAAFHQEERVVLWDAFEFVLEQVVHEEVEVLVLVFLLVHLVEPVEPLVGVGRRLLDLVGLNVAVVDRKLAILPPGVFLHLVELGLVVE